MQSFTDVINLWPSLTSFARDIRVEYVTAQIMRYRDSIAPRHWPKVVSAAGKRGFEGVTLELLTSFKANSGGKKSQTHPKRRVEARVA